MKRLDIDSFLKSHAKRCAYCGTPFFFGEGKTIDHISPKSKGVNEQGINKVVVCQACNSKKSDMPLSEFRQQVDQDCILNYARDFGSLQLPSGEVYSRSILKRFKMKGRINEL